MDTTRLNVDDFQKKVEEGMPTAIKLWEILRTGLPEKIVTKLEKIDCKTVMEAYRSWYMENTLKLKNEVKKEDLEIFNRLVIELHPTVAETICKDEIFIGVLKKCFLEILSPFSFLKYVTKLTRQEKEKFFKEHTRFLQIAQSFASKENNTFRQALEIMARKLKERSVHNPRGNKKINIKVRRINSGSKNFR